MTPRAISCCLVIAALSLAPYAADVFGVDLPLYLRLTLLLLSEGLHYMAVAVHEPGHAIFHWLFGEPALPLLDTEKGGGMTYTAGRSYALTAFVYGLAAAGVAFLVMRRRLKTASAAIALMGLHAALICSGLDRFVTLVMGHGAEITAGSALIFFAATRPDILKRRAERMIAITAGAHFWGRNAILGLGLICSETARREHAAQKGIPHLGDYQQAADIAHVTVQAIAAGMLAFLAACAIITFLCVSHQKRKGPG